MSDSYEAGDVTINSIQLTSLSSNNSVNILPQTAVISIWEDILSPFLYCEVGMTDAVGLLQSFPIIGDEILTIDFETPGRENYTANLHVYSVSDVVFSDNHSKAGYTLQCVSPEKMMDAQVQIQKGYNTTIDQIVQDIITNSLKSQNKLFYEPTKGTQQIVFPYTTPFESIEMLRTRACSTKNKSSSYLFFQNKHGYNFSTLEDIFLQNANNVGDKIFTKYNALASDFQTPLEFRNIIDYTHGKQFDIRGSINIGALNNVHQKFDIMTKTFTENSYTINQFGQFSSPDKSGATSPFTQAIIDKYGKDPAVKYFSVHDSAKPDTFIHDFFPAKIGFTSVHLNASMNIFVNGDSSISCSDAIEIELPQVDGMTKTTIEPAPLVPGIYIVKECRHIITITNLKAKHSLALGLLRGTYQN
jgi:hypothetical protein